MSLTPAFLWRNLQLRLEQFEERCTPVVGATAVPPQVSAGRRYTTQSLSSEKTLARRSVASTPQSGRLKSILTVFSLSCLFWK